MEFVTARRCYDQMVLTVMKYTKKHMCTLYLITGRTLATPASESSISATPLI